MEQQTFKRNIAYKFRIGDLLAGKPQAEGDKFQHLLVSDMQVIRVNVVANVIDKYIQDGEKRFGSITLDDGSGQVKAKVFGEDVDKFSDIVQGDTLVVIGLLRSWNNEIYISPEIIKKKDPLYLLVRKHEVDMAKTVVHDPAQILALREKIIEYVKAADKDGGVAIDSLILELHESAEIINAEVKKLLEDGVAYEPRPGKLRWLG